MDHELIDAAKAVRANAYAPYSRYPVGAAIRDENGRIFVGVNVENASYGGTICAERGATMALVAAGSKRVTAVAVVARTHATPCGLCRQFLAEFADPEAPVYIVREDGEVVTHALGALLPFPFERKALE